MNIVRRVISLIVIANLRVFTYITKRPRARVLVVNESSEILLIQAYISHGHWSLPGGGLKRHESPAAAACRELEEETGIVVKESMLTHLATFKRPEVNIPFTAEVYTVTVSKSALPSKNKNPREIVELGWFDQKKLPQPLSTIAVAALEELHKTD